MAENSLQEQIQAYDQWKSELIGTIEEFQAWLDEHDTEIGESALRIYETIEALRNDRLNIAFVAEFSRGKTELINAIFFADYQRRLLPSEAGRTTMCPTELFYDRKAGQAYVRLLPIETRLEETSITEYKSDPIYWTNIPLELDSPEQMEKALHEVIRTKRVSLEEAERLGLFSEDIHRHQPGEPGPEQEVEIPAWRHALISFPHPLLERGLVILDTPGLNALGSEPELTMNMLPACHAVLFVLAADTGVTRSDLDVWQFHIGGSRRSRQNRGVMVVLNKIDTLWDELRDDQTVSNSIEAQVKRTGSLLGVDPDVIFAVSAQKGLLAKIRGDATLAQRSQLGTLEEHLSSVVLPAREAILRDNILSGLGSLLEDQYSVLATRRDDIAKQLAELRGLSGKNADVIVHLMKKTREEQTTYQKNVESFQASRRLLQRQAKTMLDTLSLEAIDKLIANTRNSMAGSWTTGGLKKGMRGFFDGARAAMEQAAEQAEHTRRLVMAIYKKFHDEHNLPELTPRMFSVQEHQDQLAELFEEAEQFRKSPVTTMTEQSFVIKKFFINLVSRARNVFFKANQDADSWLKEVMNPLVSQIREHKHMMERRLQTLRKINESRDVLDAKIRELEGEESELVEKLKRLESIRQRLHKPLPSEASSAA